MENIEIYLYSISLFMMFWYIEILKNKCNYIWKIIHKNNDNILMLENKIIFLEELLEKNQITEVEKIKTNDILTQSLTVKLSHQDTFNKCLMEKINKQRELIKENKKQIKYLTLQLSQQEKTTNQIISRIQMWKNDFVIWIESKCKETVGIYNQCGWEKLSKWKGENIEQFHGKWIHDLDNNTWHLKEEL